MFVRQVQMHLKDTDATGVLYFSEQFRFAMETFEDFLRVRGLGLKALFNTPYLLPVVHAEADYFEPLKAGDTLEIGMEVSHIGSSSFTLSYTFFELERKLEVGKAQIVHVVVDRQKRTAVPMPDFLRSVLES